MILPIIFFVDFRTVMASSHLSVVEFRRFNENAKIPHKATTGSAGLDLYSAERIVVPPFGGKGIVSTELGLKLPANTCGIIMSRSGLCIEKSVTVFSGLIDADFRGPIKLIIFNHGNEEFVVDCNMRLAQIVIYSIIDPLLIETRDLGHTERGKHGFGSTGL